MSMDKLKTLKAIIYQICDDSQYFKKSLKDKGISHVSIKLSYTEGSLGSAQDLVIDLSIKDIVETYAFFKRFISNLDSIDCFRLNNKYSDYIRSINIRKIINVYIPSPDESLVVNQLDNSDFLSEETISELDTIAIYAMSYSLFHEFGHVLYDNELPESEQIVKECKADEFAFRAIKAIPCTDNANLLGSMMGISYVMHKLKPEVELSDKKYPHSIERLFALLDFWSIADDSQYWNLAYQVVCIWSEKNSLPMTWIKQTSDLDKDRFMDTYLYIKDKKNKENATPTT